jgi:peptidoglycan/xylan/chitin deacetylase (PgdA/CDA1 family)
MCSEDIPVGIEDIPAIERRSFLRNAGMIGGAATIAALTGCASSKAETLSLQEQTINHTFTGITPSDKPLTLSQLIEHTDAASPDDQLRGAHRLVWDLATTQPLVALTVDDGPDPRWTPKVLDALAAAGAKATFFMMGYNATKHSDLAKRIVAEGHDVGNHTWSHQDMAYEEPGAAATEIIRCKQALKSILGSTTTHFRPPRGELSGAAMRTLAEQNYDTFLWSISRNDPGIGTAEQVADHIVERLRPGAIIDMHDSIGRALFINQNEPVVKLLKAKRDVDAASVPMILKRGMAAGLKFVTLSDLLAAATNPGALSPALSPPAGNPDGPTTTPPTGTVT